MSSAGDNNQEVDADEEEDEEEDLEKLQAEIARMEEEAARITRETEEIEKSKNNKSAGSAAGENGDASTKDKEADSKAQALRDAKSVYVGQVDYSTTPTELLSHFEACGTVERVTIVCDKYTGRPKGMLDVVF